MFPPLVLKPARLRCSKKEWTKRHRMTSIPSRASQETVEYATPFIKALLSYNVFVQKQRWQWTHIPLWHKVESSFSSAFSIGRLRVNKALRHHHLRVHQGHHRHRHRVRQAPLRGYGHAPFNKPPSGDTCFRELPSGSAESLSTKVSLPRPVASGFAASALRSKHVKGPIKIPKA
ncbi:hypothetical protein CNMCM6936_002686 [Aspergillus lentulus]|nr:hypothetical protein CNMCM6069_002421 [Aspergillus lentulus]KAF4162038.1 hypothetical protein CNMCM6936_002686 [Aspergillus lentulus]KAF4170391.1 hypothetical protein CNMCM8060_005547 [Aspergillus lentulus]KAF4191721.1 hypothetical protein CNMCM8694_001394 [Aspergillus lentulus]